MSITINDYMLVFDGVTMGANLASVPINLKKIQNYAVSARWTGAPVGDVKLQASCDQGTNEVGAGVTDWVDITGATQATAGAAGSVLFNDILPPGYFWMRVVFARTSGTGTVTAKYNGKG